ncbi:MAG: lysylphosphatidylglycerol synthase transmembrane domain-containing protein [Salinivenus sp.]
MRRRLFQAASFLLAAVLLALALYGADLDRIVEAFQQADYRWLPPLILLAIVGNLFRAWRWNVLIDALPPLSDSDVSREEAAASNTLEASFSSVMIGYMINYVAPRMGEIARTANMAARTPYRFSSLLGTVVSERIFDTAVLGLALLSAVALLSDRLSILQTQFFGPAWDTLTSLPLGWLLGGLLGLVVVVGVSIALVQQTNTKDSALGRFWSQTVKPTLTSFRHGMGTLLLSPRRGALLLSTVGMWGAYLFMAYIPFRMLDLAEPYGIGIGDAWALMAIGALGLLVPTPGGIGSYHYITEQALVHLYDVPSEAALTYAVLAHGAQLVFYVLAGGAAMLYQGTGAETFFPSRTETPTPAGDDLPSRASQ